MEWWRLQMQLKRYVARSMSEALSRVKADLGPDAVILNTRTIRRGGVLGVGGRSTIEITATADAHLADVHRPARRDKPTASPPEITPGPAVADAVPVGRRRVEPDVATADARAMGQPSTDAALRREIEGIRAMVDELLLDHRRSRHPQVPAELLDYYTELIAQDVAAELASRIVQRLAERLSDEQKPPSPHRLSGAAATARDRRLRQLLIECVAEMIPPAAPLTLTPVAGPTIVALVGPTGVGKTTTIAKLAANMTLRESRRVALITTDTYRIAAVEQLKTYAQILDVPLISVLSPGEMKKAVGRLADSDLILIDTAGRSQRDAGRLDELRQFLDAAEPHQVHLVLAGNGREDAVRETIERFRPVGVNRLIFTKIDESLGFGILLNVLDAVDLQLSYLTTGQAVPADIEVGTAHRVANLVLRTGESLQRRTAAATDARPAGGSEGDSAPQSEERREQSLDVVVGGHD